jgi:hypothetical protein
MTGSGIIRRHVLIKMADYAALIRPTGIAYIVTTIFPRCLFASICANALPISANG